MLLRLWELSKNQQKYGQMKFVTSSFHSLSLNIFTLAHFISSTIFITSSSFASDPLIFSNRFTLSMITSATYVALTSNYFFTNTLSSLSHFISTCQSSHLLRLLAFHILLPEIYLSIKSNLDRYRVYCAYLQFNFCLLIKYSKFL